MATRGRAMLAGAILTGVLAGCSAPTCEEMVNHLVVNRLLPPGLKGQRIAECERSDPSARLRSCMMKVTSADEVTRCRGLDIDLEREPLTRRGQTGDEARLRELAHAVELYYIEHGRFPAPGAGPLPPVGAACRGAHAGQPQPPQPGLWTSSPWTDLGFHVDEPSRAAFWYELTDPAREAVVHAIFDLDCDGETSTAVIAIRVERGTPAQSALVTTYERD